MTGFQKRLLSLRPLSVSHSASCRCSDLQINLDRWIADISYLAKSSVPSTAQLFLPSKLSPEIAAGCDSSKVALREKTSHGSNEKAGHFLAGSAKRLTVCGLVVAQSAWHHVFFWAFLRFSLFHALESMDAEK